MGVYFSYSSRLPMLIMEYLPLSLTQCLETHQDLPLSIKYSILLDVANGLNYLHCKRPPVVHRDLSANNILLTSSLIAKISDLGVSRMANTFLQQHLTTAPGNAVVMPPEAFQDNPYYDQKLDVFSYGCLVLHVFTQQWPMPTDQYVPSEQSHGMFCLVSEWDRRARYTTAIPNNCPFFPFVKSCLDNKAKKRPTMNDAIVCAQQAASSVPPIQNQIEIMKQLNSLTQQVKEIKKQSQEDIRRLEEKVKQLEHILSHVAISKEEIDGSKYSEIAKMSCMQNPDTNMEKELSVSPHKAYNGLELQCESTSLQDHVKVNLTGAQMQSSGPEDKL